jgi:hypothetical protein
LTPLSLASLGKQPSYEGYNCIYFDGAWWMEITRDGTKIRNYRKSIQKFAIKLVRVKLKNKLYRPICAQSQHRGITMTFTEAVLSNFFNKKSGAGEGIRTLDPNLGKVVLYH